MTTMARLCCALVLALVFGFLTNQSIAEAAEWDDEVRRATVQIKALGTLKDRTNGLVTAEDYSNGSGFLIDSSGKIATTFHLVNHLDLDRKSDLDIQIKFLGSSMWRDAFVVDYDAVKDILILNISEPVDIPKVPLLSFKPSDDLAAARRKFTSLGYDNAIQKFLNASGEVSKGVSEKYPAFWYIDQITGKGRSGGPVYVFDTITNRPKIVGFIVGRYRSDSLDIGYILPLNYVLSKAGVLPGGSDKNELEFGPIRNHFKGPGLPDGYELISSNSIVSDRLHQVFEFTNDGTAVNDVGELYVRFPFRFSITNNSNSAFLIEELNFEVIDVACLIPVCSYNKTFQQKKGFLPKELGNYSLPISQAHKVNAKDLTSVNTEIWMRVSSSRIFGALPYCVLGRLNVETNLKGFNSPYFIKFCNTDYPGQYWYHNNQNSDRNVIDVSLNRRPSFVDIKKQKSFPKPSWSDAVIKKMKKGGFAGQSYLDFNGDGNKDLVFISRKQVAVSLNDGSKFKAPFILMDYVPPPELPDPPPENFFDTYDRLKYSPRSFYRNCGESVSVFGLGIEGNDYAIIADVIGDRIKEVIVRRERSLLIYSSESSEENLSLYKKYSLPATFDKESWWCLTDINKDETIELILSTGSKFHMKSLSDLASKTSNLTIIDSEMSISARCKRVVFSDLDGDNFEDALCLGQNAIIYKNQGALGKPESFVVKELVEGFAEQDGWNENVIGFSDVDKDGLMDIVGTSMRHVFVSKQNSPFAFSEIEMFYAN